MTFRNNKNIKQKYYKYVASSKKIKIKYLNAMKTQL